MKRKFVFTSIFFLFFLTSIAQDLRLNLFGGMANYNGDLQSKNLTFKQAKYAIGTWVSYDINPKIMLRAGLHFAKVNAADKFQTDSFRYLRNLSFATNILEIQAGAEYHFLGMDNRVFSPYLFGSVAGFHFNSYATSAAGNKVYLKPLSTEGQGLTGYPSRKPYSLFQFAIPFGVGLRMQLTERFDVGAEFGYRKTFTDYIDDVSKTYVDQYALLSERGPLAVQMAYRTPELPAHNTDPYPPDMQKRGGSQYKDNYYFLGVTLSYHLTGSNSAGNGSVFKSKKGGGKRKSNLGCPTNVY